MFAVSGRALKDLVNGSGELERETIADECEPVQLVTKTKRGKHLWMRQGTAELLGETETTIGHRSGRIMGWRCEVDYERKGGGKGLAVGLIGERAW